MPALLATVSIFLLLGLVLARVLLLASLGIDALHFGRQNRTDFLILPFVFFYIYLIFAHALHLPSVSGPVLFVSEPIAWAGVLCCALGLALMLWSLVSFGRSFRIGIDADRPGELVTTGVFAFSRNPIYTAIELIMLGQFLIFPNWLILAFLFAGIWMFHRQVLREEAYLKQRYGPEYADYLARVRRYL
jgi:protein-S-isoprenylcysteine O-methyltransferase Ste14